MNIIKRSAFDIFLRFDNFKMKIALLFQLNFHGTHWSTNQQGLQLFYVEEYR